MKTYFKVLFLIGLSICCLVGIARIIEGEPSKEESKNNPLVSKIETYDSIEKDSVVNDSVLSDSINYWRAENVIKYDRPSDVYFFKTPSSGILYTYKSSDDYESVVKVTYEFDYTITGKLMLLSFNGQTEYWIIFDKNTLVSHQGRNDKLRRIK